MFLFFTSTLLGLSLDLAFSPSTNQFRSTTRLDTLCPRGASRLRRPDSCIISNLFRRDGRRDLYEATIFSLCTDTSSKASPIHLKSDQWNYLASFFFSLAFAFFGVDFSIWPSRPSEPPHRPLTHHDSTIRPKCTIATSAHPRA